MFYLCKIFHSEEIYCTAFIFKNSLESLFRLSQQKLKQGKCLLQIQVNRQHNSTSMHRVTNELVLKFRRNYGEKKFLSSNVAVIIYIAPTVWETGLRWRGRTIVYFVWAYTHTHLALGGTSACKYNTQTKNARLGITLPLKCEEIQMLYKEAKIHFILHVVSSFIVPDVCNEVNPKALY